MKRRRFRGRTEKSASHTLSQRIPGPTQPPTSREQPVVRALSCMSARQRPISVDLRERSSLRAVIDDVCRWTSTQSLRAGRRGEEHIAWGGWMSLSLDEDAREPLRSDDAADVESQGSMKNSWSRLAAITLQTYSRRTRETYPQREAPLSSYLPLRSCTNTGPRTIDRRAAPPAPS